MMGWIRDNIILKPVQIKEKAIAKLKEIKSRSDETGLKAKQYLEGLLKIPFNVYREEPILKKVKEINKVFLRFNTSVEQLFPDEKVSNKKEEDKNFSCKNVFHLNCYEKKKILMTTLCLMITRLRKKMED